MTEIIRFSWNEEYAVSGDFDLNQLRKMVSVKEVKGQYVLNEENHMEVKFGKNVVVDKQEADELQLEKIQDESNQRYQWYQQEKKEKDKLAEELKCLKAQIAEMQAPTPVSDQVEDTVPVAEQIDDSEITGF